MLAAIPLLAIFAGEGVFLSRSAYDIGINDAMRLAPELFRALLRDQVSTPFKGADEAAPWAAAPPERRQYAHVYKRVKRYVGGSRTKPVFASASD